jgi:hypothetical protein
MQAPLPPQAGAPSPLPKHLAASERAGFVRPWDRERRAIRRQPLRPSSARAPGRSGCATSRPCRRRS